MKTMFQKQKSNQVKHRPKSQNDIANMSNIQIQNQSQDEGLSDNDGDDEQKNVNILYQDIEKQQFLEIL